MLSNHFSLHPLNPSKPLVPLSFIPSSRPLSPPPPDTDVDVLGVDLDVLDDFEGEAKEVARVNPWLNYSPPLHRIRETGAYVEMRRGRNRRDEDRGKGCPVCMRVCLYLLSKYALCCMLCCVVWCVV
jgi:hypothetical protein